MASCGEISRTMSQLESDAVPGNWSTWVDAEPPLGAHLCTPRHGYAHHGIYVGHGMVVHYAGYCHRRQCGPVEELTIAAFAGGHCITVLPTSKERYSATESIRRARSRLGEDHYRLLTNNCEHLCNWCLYGESRSDQVRHCLTHPISGLLLVLNMLASRWTTAASLGWGCAAAT